jgi:transcriptional regulator with XRE-family HTH domain
MTEQDKLKKLDAFEDETDRARLITALVDLRTKQHLTQAEVARRMGITQSTVSQFEQQGQEGRDSTVTLIQRYARAIDVELRMWIEPKKPEAVETPAVQTRQDPETLE